MLPALVALLVFLAVWVSAVVHENRREATFFFFRPFLCRVAGCVPMVTLPDGCTPRDIEAARIIGHALFENEMCFLTLPSGFSVGLIHRHR